MPDGSVKIWFPDGRIFIAVPDKEKPDTKEQQSFPQQAR